MHYSSQTSLEGIVTQEAKSPIFTNARLMDYIIELVICEDEVSKAFIFWHPANIATPGVLFSGPRQLLPAPEVLPAFPFGAGHSTPACASWGDTSACRDC